MDSAEPRMSNLFLQLGLDASDEAIAAFIKTHQLDSGTHLGDAPYWNKGQRQFLTEQIGDDAAWAVIVDQLNESLHADAVKKQMQAI